MMTTMHRLVTHSEHADGTHPVLRIRRGTCRQSQIHVIAVARFAVGRNRLERQGIFTDRRLGLQLQGKGAGRRLRGGWCWY